MKSIMMSILALALMFSTTSRPAFAWGAYGHETVARVGTELSPGGKSFWMKNEDNMAMLTLIPDSYWKSLKTAPTEKPTHYFEIDSYYSSPKQYDGFPTDFGDAVAQFSEDHVVKHGTAIWRAQQLYDLAVEAFADGDETLALQMAGTMSHYLGDLSQPLHVAENYDGKMTGDPGIHAYFETKNLEANASQALEDTVMEKAVALLATAEYKEMAELSVVEIALLEGIRSHSYKDKLINIDLKYDRKDPKGKQELLKLAIDRLADGAAVVGLVLTKMWNEAKLSRHSARAQYFSPLDLFNVVVGKVGKPDWVRPVYDGYTIKLGDGGGKTLSLFDGDDD